VLAALDDGSSLVARSTDDGLEFDIRLQGEAETVFFAV
jgi:protocatechuate 3,4-dioxygenase beta subunit